MGRRDILHAFRAGLKSVGYTDRLILADYEFADFGEQESLVGRVPLAAFSGYPCTYRSACVGVVMPTTSDQREQFVVGHRALGAPLVFEVRNNEVQAWAVGPKQARPVGDTFTIGSLEHVFRDHHESWNPSALGRVKSPADVRPNQQLDFFDAGLLPVLTEFFQSKLKDLLERAFTQTAARYEELFGKPPETALLFPYLFRFVTAKIFMDRADARGWNGLTDPLEVFRRAEQHSGSGLLAKLPPEYLDRRVLERAWQSVSQSLHFQNLSVPDLAFVYESSFINEKTRRELGVHSTPSGLANYIVQHLPWDRIPVNERTVLEPFCGHGIFLACALARLREDLDSGLTGKQRHVYFRSMLAGVEKDPLAIEVCRLILTLSDYPNENRWQLYQDDVFSWPRWNASLDSAAVVLANPPYETFSAEERRRLSAVKASPPAELLHRLMRKPPQMLGLVLPQSFLSSPFYQEANRAVAEHYDEVAIVELPRIFRYADNETIALIASGRREKGRHVVVKYSEVLPNETDEFFEDFHVSRARSATLAVSAPPAIFTLWLPAKGTIWDTLAHLQPLGELATIRKGINWVPRHDGKPRTAPRTDVASDRQKNGYHLGAEKMAGNLSQFQVKRFRYLSLRGQDQDPRTSAHKHPWSKRKVVCNAARFERKSPWRMAAWADAEGRAFTKEFFALWPQEGLSEFAVAAILCSPVANAFSFMHDLERHNHISTLRRLPLPSVEHLKPSGELHRRAKRLQTRLTADILAGGSQDAELLESLIRLDAAVLDAYELPVRTQRQLLDQFQGWRRPIAVDFSGYFPEHFRDAVSLADLVAIRYDWQTTNDRRCDLIDKDISSARLTPEERAELDRLQYLADLLIRLEAPYPLGELDGFISRLKAKGKWKDSI